MSSNGHTSTIQRMIDEVNRSLTNVKYVIAVLSCKGGVGKSLISASLAVCLRMLGKKVAILDADMHGPSIPWMLGLESTFIGATIDGKLVPVEIDGIATVSLELLLEDKEQPVVWRGPLKTRTLIQILTSTLWGERDYMIVDLPPGTGDEALTIAQMLSKKLSGVVLVMTPNEMVKHVVSKAKRFVEALGIPMIGVVINMSYLVCPRCGARIEIFGSKAPLPGVEILGEVPLDPELARAIEQAKLIEYLSKDSESSRALREIAKKVVEHVEKS